MPYDFEPESDPAGFAETRLAALARPQPTPSRVLADDQLIVLHEVAKSIAQDRSLQACLSLIADKARYLTSSSSIAVCLLDEDRETLDFAAVAGRGAAEMLGQRVRAEDALPGQTAMTGEPLLAFNPADPASGSKSGPPTPAHSAAAIFDEPFVRSGGVRSAAVVPIMIGSSSVGSLAAINRLDGESYTGSDLLMLQMLASSASIAIQKDFLVRQASLRERERNILFRVAQNTAASLDVQKILDSMLETLTASVDMFAAVIFLLNDERTHLYIAASHGLIDEERDVQILADGRLAAAALSGGGRAFVISDVEHDARFEEFLSPQRAPAQSMMVVPLAARDAPSGLMVVLSHRLGAYSKDELTLLAAVSAQTAIAIENAWLYEDATRRAEEATAIYELSQAVNTNLNLRSVLNFVADSILALLQIDKFALFLHNPDKNCLEIKVARNMRRETVATMHPSPEHRGIAWWVYEYETPTAVQDVAADHRNRSCPLDDEGVSSLVSVPLQSGENVIGVIHAMSSRRRAFSVAEMELLYTIANQVGTAVSNIQRLQETRQKSDDLRRSFRRVARALGASADKTQTGQSIAELACDTLRVERAVLYLASDASGAPPSLSILAAHGLRLPQSAQGATASVSAGAETSAAWIARRGRVLAIETPTQDPRFLPASLLAPYVARSGFYLGVPLKVGKRIVGVLEMYGRDARALPADELRQFLTLAAQAAVALQNALLIEDAGRRKRDLETIAHISAVLRLGSALDQRVLTVCVAQLVEAAGAECALVSLAKPRSKRKGILIDRHGVVDGDGDGNARDVLRSILDSGKDLPGGEMALPGAQTGAWPGKGDPRPVYRVDFADSTLLASLCVARRPGAAPFSAVDAHLIKIIANLIGMASS